MASFNGVSVWRTWRSRDPPVCMDNSEPFCTALAHQEWVQENGTFSEFALQMLIVETLYSSKYCRWGWAEAASLSQITSRFQEMGFPAWHYPADVTRLWSGPGVLVCTQEDGVGGDLVEIAVGSRSPSAHTDATTGLPVTWEPARGF